VKGSAASDKYTTPRPGSFGRAFVFHVPGAKIYTPSASCRDILRLPGAAADMFRAKHAHLLAVHVEHDFGADVNAQPLLP
jgi:hypothetical protein